MLDAQHALAVYAESLAADRRVAVLGDSSLGIGERMLDLGARAVLVWDPDEERAEQQAAMAPAGVVVRGLPRDDEDIRAGSVDLALVTDLSLFDDPQGLLAIVRRAVGDEGIAVVAAANRDAAASAEDAAFDYYELFDLVAGEFEDVRMVAQLSFYGVALAELGRDDEAPSVSVDTQLAEAGRTPEAFVAIASAGGVSLEPYAIVELPAPPLGALLEPEPAADEETEAALAQAQLRTHALAAQLEEARARLAEVELASAAAVYDQGEQLRGRAARVIELERALADRAAQLAELAGEVEEMRSAAQAGRVAAAQVEELARRADRAERALAALEPEVSRIGEAHAAEHARFEEVLRDRAQAIRVLEAEVARRDRMVRELVDALDEDAGRPPPPFAGIAEAQPAPADSEDREGPPAAAPGEDALARENVRLRERLDALALELAHRKGEAQAAAWAVAELERRVAQTERLAPAARAASAAARDDAARATGATDATTGAGGELGRQLTAALDELDVLRQAFAQEHALRLHAESGEELAHARAEIQRQAALLEELGHPVQVPGTGLHPTGK